MSNRRMCSGVQVEHDTGHAVGRSLLSWLHVSRVLATGMLLTGLLLCGPVAHAMDHVDGPAVRGDPSVDLTDFFVFPTQGSPVPRLALILSVNSEATAETRFSDVVTYAFRVRRVAKSSRKPMRFQTGSKEVAISCRAERPSGPEMEQWVTCTVEEFPKRPKRQSAVLSSRVRVNDTSGGPEARLRVFAGQRADQSFGDEPLYHLPCSRDQGRRAAPEMAAPSGMNVLSIVVELDVGAVLGSLGKGSLYAAVAQTSVTREREGRRETRQLDRMGRVEVAAFMSLDGPHQDFMVLDGPHQDLWNATDSFLPPDSDSSNAKLFLTALQTGLAILDNCEKSLAGKSVIDWPVPHPFVSTLFNDFLVVDVSKPVKPSSSEPGYLEIETSTWAGKPHATCGGRKPNEDVIARTLALFIHGPERHRTDGGVAAPARPAQDVFPYVSPPFVPAGDVRYR
jgi:hypothetical protein